MVSHQTPIELVSLAATAGIKLVLELPNAFYMVRTASNKTYYTYHDNRLIGLDTFVLCSS